MKGFRVLLVDTDPQGSATSILGRANPDAIDNTLASIFEKEINEATYNRARYAVSHNEEGIDYIPGNIELSGVEVSLVSVLGRETILKGYLEEMREYYDYIIVDEFQDISIDRYKFLKALRGTKPAKLFCVGDDWQSIYRFSGSDMALFNHFSDFFGPTDIKKIENTYRFGEPLVSLSSKFILRNNAQIKKSIRPYSNDIKTEIFFKSYERQAFCDEIDSIIKNIPNDKSIFLLGRYSFDDYYLSFKYKCIKDGNRFYYNICGRKIEFLTVHKSKGLEADYVILLQCNKDIFGFPSQMSDDPILNYVLTQSDNFPFGEERRLFYVAMTRAKISTIVLYDKRFPSVFVDEFLHPEKITEKSYIKHPNAQKKWTRGEEAYLIKLHSSGKSIKFISQKMGRSQTSIIMRLGKLGVD